MFRALWCLTRPFDTNLIQRMFDKFMKLIDYNNIYYYQYIAI